MKMSLPSVLTASVLACVACNKQPEPIPTEKSDTPAASTTAALSASSASATPSAAHNAGPSDIAYDAPKAWTSAPNPSPMRKATFKIPKQAPDTDDAELAISSASGGVEPNIKRWEGQFGNAKATTDKRTVNGLAVTMVEIKGKYASGMMGGASSTKDNQMLLGAIVDGGDQQFFFKMIGGEKTVTASKKDFDSFVSSFRGK